jgi:hypothetical protein
MPHYHSRTAIRVIRTLLMVSVPLFALSVSLQAFGSALIGATDPLIRIFPYRCSHLSVPLFAFLRTRFRFLPRTPTVCAAFQRQRAAVANTRAPTGKGRHLWQRVRASAPLGRRACGALAGSPKQQKRTPTADGAAVAVVAQFATRAWMRRRCSGHCEAEGDGDGDAEAQESTGGSWKRQQERRLVSPHVLAVLCEYCEYCRLCRDYDRLAHALRGAPPCGAALQCSVPARGCEDRPENRAWPSAQEEAAEDQSEAQDAVQVRT